MRVNPVTLTNLTSVSDLVRFLSPFCNQVGGALSNGLNFQDNIQASSVVFYFGSTASQQIQHGLNNTPIGFVAIQSSGPALYFNGNSPLFGATFCNIKSSVVGVTATLLFF